jgi:transcriptional regulator with XRE-family HTH domain
MRAYREKSDDWSVDAQSARGRIALMVDYRKVLAANLRRRRKELGLSQEALAFEAEIDRTYVSGLERAKRNPSLTLIGKLAEKLRTTPAELLRAASLDPTPTEMS